MKNVFRNLKSDYYGIVFWILIFLLLVLLSLVIEVWEVMFKNNIWVVIFFINFSNVIYVIV